MLCLPALNQSEFSGSPMAAAAASSIRAQHCGYLPSASTPTPAPAALNSSYNNSPSSSSLYSLPLPPQPQNLDSFSLPSSSTPCSMPAAPSWQSQAAAPNSSNTTTSINNTTTPKQPLILDSLTASKISIVENLVDTAALIIESIWPSPVGASCTAKTPVIPLHIFVKETLRRSRTTLSTLQLALYYVYKIRNQVLAAQEKIRHDHLQQQHRQRQNMQNQHQPLSPNGSFDNYCSDDDTRQQRDYFHSISAVHAKAQIQKNSLPLTPPGANHTPTALSPLSLSASTSTSPILAKSEPVGCGRRMFLAALILASKFQQDRTYSNKAWSKISGLPVAEINLNEITFLTLIDYRLFVSQTVFQKWVTILTEKGKCRDRSASTRTFNSDGAVQQTTRRNSIQYCNNTLPSRMTCVTASSLEQQQQQPQQSSTPTAATVAPHLPSFALFVAEQQRSLQSTPICEKPSFQFEMVLPLGAPALSKQALDAHSSANAVSGLVQPESAPRQQQGMGASMTLRWVQDQRREFIRSRLLSMGYTVNQQQQPSESPSQAQLAQRNIVENYKNNVIMMYSQTGTYSLNMHHQQPQQQLKIDTAKAAGVKTFLPSPTSSGSPTQLTGSKRHMTDSEESEEMKDQRSLARRRLSVSFLVDC
ncbi:hypothetical protein EC957_008157 [Mortierella hygrophila]|uniref:G1/S-specific cyclin pas1 n=1 Tax=Mortierella hygrophila TaxID=979708 RepID=A0A9P6FJ78_9FUNG|nr:hypothetical protein EC957_008157 [Mortierella hygrophila]